MKKTMKKTMSLIIATLMLALAIPFAMITVAADEATPTQIDLVDVDFFGNHLDGTTPVEVAFYAAYPDNCAFDGDITTDAQIVNNNRNGNTIKPYEMCYFNADGVMTNGVNPDEQGKSYYGMFVIELSEVAVLDTLSLWTPYVGTNDEAYMANNGYDIYYSADGQTYAAVEGATFENVYTNKDTNGYYVEGTYNGKNGHVHVIDMKGVTAEYIAIAVSELVSGADEALLSEVVLMGNAIVDDTDDENNQNNGSQSSPNTTDDNKEATDTKKATDTKAATSAVTETEATEEKGCGSSLSVAGVALVGAIVAGIVVTGRKKKEN